MKIDIIGRGNVGSHLLKAISESTDFSCVLIDSRSLTNLRKDADIYLIAVSDDAIISVAERLKEFPLNLNAIFVHTSGSVDLEVLKNFFCNVGVLYPLQTFSKNDRITYSEIPFFIEGNSPIVEKELQRVASSLSAEVAFADSNTRRLLHLASVFACNFTNALCSISDEILAETDFDMRHLLPLMHQTVDKLCRLKPKEAQTGPAKRKDMKIIKNHLGMLKAKPEIKNIYELLSNYIMSHLSDHE